MAENMTNQDKLDEMYHLLQENNDILRAMRRRENVAMIFRFFYWVVIIASLSGIYYFISPIISKFQGNAAKLEEGAGQFDELRKVIPQGESFSNFFHSLQNMGSSSDTGTSSETVQ